MAGNSAAGRSDRRQSDLTADQFEAAPPWRVRSLLPARQPALDQLEQSLHRPGRHCRLRCERWIPQPLFDSIIKIAITLELIMANNLSLRGLDALTLARIKSSARRRKLSVNRLIIETLREQYATGEQTFDDLDALAGAWSKSEAAQFAAAVAPFSEIDAGL